MALPMILQQLNGKTINQPTIPNNLTQVKNMIRLIKNAGNPQALLNNMMAQNPHMKQAMNYIKNNGGDPKTAFEKLAKEQGIDPAEIERMLKG